MQVRFPYPDVPPLEVPDSNFLGYHHPKRVPDAPPAYELVRQALANPIGAPQLSESVRAGQKVLIVVDDSTRPTPQDLLLPAVIEELHRCGVRDEDIRILIAYGSHRPMTPLEKRRKLGSHIVNRYEVLDHGWESAGASAAALSDVGRVIKEKARGIMASSGIQPDVQEKLGFRPAETPQEALELAFGMTSRKATVIVFHHGGEILPIVGGKTL